MSAADEIAIHMEQTALVDEIGGETELKTKETHNNGLDALWTKIQELEDKIDKISTSKENTTEKQQKNETESEPQDDTEEEDESSSVEIVLHYVGKCILLILMIIHKMHTICGTLILRRIKNRNSMSILKYYWIPFAFAITLYLSLPLIINSILLFVLNIYDEVQSWMIAHIVWGFCVSMYWMFYVIVIKSGKYNSVNAMLWKVIGIDLPVEQQKSKGFISVLLASLIPAITAGFIANFILEEKFILECDKNTKESNLCADNRDKCCTIISSHDISNMYVFIGSLVSNILGMFALIRITAWLMTKGDPTLMKVSKRRK